MADRKESQRRGLKARLSQLLTFGAGTVVVATTVTTGPAAALPTQPAEPVVARAEQARAKLSAEMPSRDAEASPQQLAWWGNWGNGGYHPWWHNWPNWRNWHNWGNW